MIKEFTKVAHRQLLYLDFQTSLIKHSSIERRDFLNLTFQTIQTQ